MKNLPGSFLKNLLTLEHTLSLAITIKSLMTITAVTAAKKNDRSNERKQCICTFVWHFNLMQNNNCEKRNFGVSDVTFVGYLLELVKNANLMAAVSMGNVRLKNKLS